MSIQSERDIYYRMVRCMIVRGIVTYASINKRKMIVYLLVNGYPNVNV